MKEQAKKNIFISTFTGIVALSIQKSLGEFDPNSNSAIPHIMLGTIATLSIFSATYNFINWNNSSSEISTPNTMTAAMRTDGIRYNPNHSNQR